MDASPKSQGPGSNFSYPPVVSRVLCSVKIWSCVKSRAGLEWAADRGPGKQSLCGQAVVIIVPGKRLIMRKRFHAAVVVSLVLAVASVAGANDRKEPKAII